MTAGQKADKTKNHRVKASKRAALTAAKRRSAAKAKLAEPALIVFEAASSASKIIRVGNIKISVTGAEVAQWAEAKLGAKVLGAAMASNPSMVSPEMARSLQAEENWWRTIEETFQPLSSTQAAELLGASKTNRNYASSQRAAGKLLGFTRNGRTRLPDFQFDFARGAVRPIIPQLIRVSRSNGVPDEDLILWLVSRSTFFAELDRPVDHLDDPGRLLAAAHDQFGAIW